MRWGYTGRVSLPMGGHEPNPIRHAWDGYPARRKHAPVRALCGAALRGLGPRGEPFDPKHERACNACRKAFR